MPAVAWPDWTPAPGLDGGYAEWYWYWITQFPNGPVRQFHERTYGSNFHYQNFATQDRFHAELFDPDYCISSILKFLSFFLSFLSFHVLCFSFSLDSNL